MRFSIAICAAALLLAACRTATEPSALPVSRALASCVPGDSVLVAAVQLDRIRGTAAGRALAAHGFAFDGARRVVAAYNGSDFVIALSGDFAQPPAGAAMLGRGLAVMGGDAAVRAASAQHASGRPGAPDLLARLPDAAIAAAVRGGIALPLSGNAANLNRVLRQVRYATMAANLQPDLDATIRGECPTADEAASVEQSVRAFLTLSGAALRQAVRTELQRADRTVEVRLSAPAAESEAILRGLLGGR